MQFVHDKKWMSACARARLYVPMGIIRESAGELVLRFLPRDLILRGAIIRSDYCADFQNDGGISFIIATDARERESVEHEKE
jgi:hypothetical protein